MLVGRSILFATVAAMALGQAALADESRHEALGQFKPLPSTTPAVSDNPITPAKIDLGKALTEQQKHGLRVFMEAGCSSCHSGINLGGSGYYPFGLIEKPEAEILPAGDKGRFAVAETADDEYVFRAAPLRNIAVTAPFFHTGKVWDLQTAVEIMASSQLGVDLAEEDVLALTAFLDSLTGQVPEVVYPILRPETASTPRPTGEVMPN